MGSNHIFFWTYDTKKFSLIILDLKPLMQNGVLEEKLKLPCSQIYNSLVNYRFYLLTPPIRKETVNFAGWVESLIVATPSMNVALFELEENFINLKLKHNYYLIYTKKRKKKGTTTYKNKEHLSQNVQEPLWLW